MATEQSNDLNNMSYNDLMNLDEGMEDEKEDALEDQYEMQSEYTQGYENIPEAKLSPHSFLHRAAFESGDTVRTTFLLEGELGRPLFTVRTMLDLEDISNHYINPLLEYLNLDKKCNIISSYFKSKIQNVTDSGMSNKGFAMNLNVTQKKDVTRKRMREGNIDNLKGGSAK